MDDCSWSLGRRDLLCDLEYFNVYSNTVTVSVKHHHLHDMTVNRIGLSWLNRFCRFWHTVGLKVHMLLYICNCATNG